MTVKTQVMIMMVNLWSNRWRLRYNIRISFPGKCLINKTPLTVLQVRCHDALHSCQLQFGGRKGVTTPRTRSQKTPIRSQNRLWGSLRRKKTSPIIFIREVQISIHVIASPEGVKQSPVRQGIVSPRLNTRLLRQRTARNDMMAGDCFTALRFVSTAFRSARAVSIRSKRY
jgi:hypothetical protein